MNTKENHVGIENTISILSVQLDDKLYEVHWNERDNSPEATFPEYGTVEDMTQEEYDDLVEYIKTNKNKEK